MHVCRTVDVLVCTSMTVVTTMVLLSISCGDREGILEEVIAIDRSGLETSTSTGNSGSPPLSPSSARKYEMTSVLLDSMWPNVVEAVS